MSRLRIVFMGTPDFAATILGRLAVWAGGEIVGVYCREDKPAGRGHRLTPPPVKVVANSLGIPVFQPRNFRDARDVDVLAGLAPDVLIVAAYGLILPQVVLDIPRRGPYNIHASLLPRWRGSAPIQRAIMAGDVVTGITVMRMEAGLDTGPIMSQRALAIGISDTAATLHDELADLGARLMLEFLEALRSGPTPDPVQQDDSLSTYAARLEKKDGFISWNAPVKSVHAVIRGVTPWPGARTLFRCGDRHDLPLLVHPGRPAEPNPADLAGSPAPGTILGLRDEHLAVVCGDGVYLISEVRVSGKRTIGATDFWNGYAPRNAGTAMLITPGTEVETA